MTQPERGGPAEHHTPEHHAVVVIGGGQAGLSISWHLRSAGVEHIVLERAGIAGEWRTGRWDNFTLVTPNWQCRLPGYAYRGDDPDGFMVRDAVHDFVRSYADTFDAPVRVGQEVIGLTHRTGEDVGESDDRATDGFLLTVRLPDGAETTMTADQVVIATGGYHHPVIPASADRLPARIHQLHSSEYKNADQLPAGGVLVVGSGQSGAQIAEDLHLAGRTVTLAVGSAPRVARFYRGRDCVAWLQDMGHYDRPVAQHPDGLATREKTNHYVTGRDGGRDIDLRAFALQGMELYGRLRDIRGEQLTLAPTLEQCLDGADRVADGIKDAIDDYIRAAGIDAPTEPRYVPVWRPEQERVELDLAAAGINSVVWAIGYRADYRWVQIGVFDGVGHPRHVRGVTGVDGLYFLGLPWLHTWGSGRFAGIARDAGYLAETLLARIADRADRAVGAGPAGVAAARQDGLTREHALL